jgi:hypothetical protein
MHAQSKLVIGLSILALIAMLSVSGCGEQEDVVGFVLPEGDVALGQANFVHYGCPLCHVVAGTDIPYLGADAIPRIELGGKVRKVKDYGDLMTSVVNPSHALADQYVESLPEHERETATSPMPNFNERLTVAELIDLVAFLHSRYEKTVPEYTGYQYGP